MDDPLFFGAPEEIRTPDPLVRSQVLYPAELRARSRDYSGKRRDDKTWSYAQT